MLRRTLIPAILLGSAAMLQAQVPNPSPTRELPYDRGYDKDTPKHEAVDAQEQPVTRELNDTSATGAAVITADADAAAAAEVHYAADMNAYRDAVRAHAQATMRDEARFNRQQQAYAQAMRVWRTQTYQCEKGKMSACKLPTPNPADYY